MDELIKEIEEAEEIIKELSYIYTPDIRFKISRLFTIVQSLKEAINTKQTKGGREMKECERCGKEFDSDEEEICLECAMTEEDGIYLERDMCGGDK